MVILDFDWEIFEANDIFRLALFTKSWLKETKQTRKNNAKLTSVMLSDTLGIKSVNKINNI